MPLNIPSASGAERPHSSGMGVNSRFPTFIRAGQTVNAGWKKGGRIAKKGWRWMLGLVLFFFAFHTGFTIYASILVNRELSEIRAKGEPLKYTELAPPEVPDSQNAALIYAQATKAIIDGKKVDEISGKDTGLDSAKRQEAIAVLRQNQKAIELTRRAASMTRCRFPVNWNGNPLKITFPHYAEQRRLARLMAAQAQWEAESGDVEAALRDVRAIYQIADHLHGDPVIIGFLVARAIQKVGENALVRVLQAQPVSASKGRAFLQSLPDSNWAMAYRNALLGERTFSIWIFSDLQGNVGNLQAVTGMTGGEDAASTAPSPLLTVPLSFLWKPFLKMDEVYNLRLWKQVFVEEFDANGELPSFGIHKVGDVMAKGVEKAPRYAVMTKILLPVFARFGQNYDQIEVSKRQNEVGLALAAFRAAYGTYPETLAQAEKVWGKKLPLDPYNSQPFYYVKEGKSFVLYSVGINGADDKGASAYSQGAAGRRANPNADDIRWGPSVRE